MLSSVPMRSLSAQCVGSLRRLGCLTPPPPGTPHLRAAWALPAVRHPTARRSGGSFRRCHPGGGGTGLAVRAAANDDPSSGLKDVGSILEKYGASAGDLPAKRSQQQSQPQKQAARANGMGNGVFVLLVLNFVLFGLQQFFLSSLPLLSQLPLHHWRPQWWQFITAAFVHGSWEHLSGNAFALLVFGRMVEEEEGAAGVWISYLLSGLGGTVASYLTSPHTHTISLGASGAVFGLFMVSLVTKFKPSLKKLLEVVILGQFVIKQVAGEFQMATSGKALAIGNMQVGHVAHLAGAAVGVLLVLLLARLPEPQD